MDIAELIGQAESARFDEGDGPAPRRLNTQFPNQIRPRGASRALSSGSGRGAGAPPVGHLTEA
ncbi:hypothetical protein, partial [Nocardia cyriacigeorgica]|uniref:hypothetical protein n=1 Tax=Nocardia cyriacigeorgica TaxID=135487 RepID=UPI0024541212